MARTYANIDAGIWRDEEFCALSAGAQRTYFMLITQTDITACGSLALTLRRWAATCADKLLKEWLEELADYRFVLVDEDTEELLVRTFVKWDGGHKHPKRCMAVVATAKAIRSLPLRNAVADELAKLGVPIANPMPSDRQSVPTEQATDSCRSVVKEGEYVCTPHSTLLESEPSGSEDDPEPHMFCDEHMPNGTTKPCGPCGTRKMRHGNWAKRQDRHRAELAKAKSAALLAERAAAKAASVPRPKETA